MWMHGVSLWVSLFGQALVVTTSCRTRWPQVAVPEALQTELRAKMEAAGIPVPDSEDRWAKALEALKVSVCCITII